MIIYEFDRNSIEKVRISLEEFKGKKLIHIRIFEDYKDGKGYRPTTKGVAIDVSLASELRKGIDRLFAKVEMEES
jgi:hypothetical protein